MNLSICCMNIVRKAVIKPISYLNKLINDENEFPQLHYAMKAKQNIVAMDVGCAFPSALIILNEKYNLSKAICIDEKTEKTVVIDTIGLLKKPWQADTVSEFYFKSGGGCMKTMEQFAEVFSKHSFWGTSAEQALIENRRNKVKVDILFCQNFLHMWGDKSEWGEWFDIFTSVSKSDTTFICRVEQKPWFDYVSFKSVLSRYYNGTMYEFYIDGMWNNSYFINLK